MHTPEFLQPTSNAEDAMMGVVEVLSSVGLGVATGELFTHTPADQLQFTLQSIAEFGGGVITGVAAAGLAVHGAYRYVRAWRNDARGQEPGQRR